MNSTLGTFKTSYKSDTLQRDFSNRFFTHLLNRSRNEYTINQKNSTLGLSGVIITKIFH